MCGHGHTDAEIRKQQRIQENNAQKLYIIKNESQKVKVGLATDVRSRMTQIRTASPEEIEVVAVFDPPHPQAAEKKIHKRLSDRNERGEWFNYDNDDVWSLVEGVELMLGKDTRLKGPKMKREPSKRDNEAQH